jgi:hypothetical protein
MSSPRLRSSCRTACSWCILLLLALMQPVRLPTFMSAPVSSRHSDMQPRAAQLRERPILLTCGFSGAPRHWPPECASAPWIRSDLRGLPAQAAAARRPSGLAPAPRATTAQWDGAGACTGHTTAQARCERRRQRSTRARHTLRKGAARAVTAPRRGVLRPACCAWVVGGRAFAVGGS